MYNSDLEIQERRNEIAATQPYIDAHEWTLISWRFIPPGTEPCERCTNKYRVRSYTMGCDGMTYEVGSTCLHKFPLVPGQDAVFKQAKRELAGLHKAWTIQDKAARMAKQAADDARALAIAVAKELSEQEQAVLIASKRKAWLDRGGKIIWTKQVGSDVYTACDPVGQVRVWREGSAWRANRGEPIYYTSAVRAKSAAVKAVSCE
jgi:hypothetical protein